MAVSLADRQQRMRQRWAARKAVNRIQHEVPMKTQKPRRVDFEVYGPYKVALDLWKLYRSVGVGDSFEDWLRACAFINRHQAPEPEERT
jgi:hypothetical protein